MKIINFINSADPNTIRSGRIWLRCTFILACITFAIITYMEISQIQTWSRCRCEYIKNNAAIKQHTHVIEEKKKLLEKEQKLKNYVNTIIHLHDKCCKNVESLNLLRTLQAHGSYLTSCSLNSDTTDITLNCKTIDQAQLCCTMLNKNKNCLDLNIASIIPKKRSLSVTLKSFNKIN